jgi:hypothetical protein
MTTQRPDFSDLDTRERLSPAAIRVFADIMQAWSIEEKDAASLLGNVPLETYRALKNDSANVCLDEKPLICVSLVVGIYKALHTYFGQVADHWLTHPNDHPLFAGATPVEFLLSHGVEGMVEVRQMLDGWCLGH